MLSFASGDVRTRKSQSSLPENHLIYISQIPESTDNQADTGPV
jgi:hypothetical protein